MVSCAEKFRVGPRPRELFFGKPTVRGHWLFPAQPTPPDHRFFFAPTQKQSGRRVTMVRTGSLGVQLLWLLYLFFLLAMVIVGLVFLSTNISDNRDAIPNFNATMYNFLFVGLWIIVGVAGLDFVLTLVGIGYLVNTMAVLPDERRLLLEEWKPSAPVRKPNRGRRLAQRASRKSR